MPPSCGPRKGSDQRHGPGIAAAARHCVGLALLVLLQIYLGALVAGLDAGLVYNTWPGIDGSLIPAADRLWFDAPWWRNLFENTLTVQFDHRMVAYTLWLVALLHLADVIRARRGGGASTARWRCLRCRRAGQHRHRHVAPPGAAAARAAAPDHRHRVLTIAVIHAERLSEAGGMIELEHAPGIATCRMTHGKANTLDIESCDAIAAQFNARARRRHQSRSC